MDAAMDAAQLDCSSDLCVKVCEGIDQSLIQASQNEFAILSYLKHQNIVKVYRSFTD